MRPINNNKNKLNSKNKYNFFRTHTHLSYTEIIIIFLFLIKNNRTFNMCTKKLVTLGKVTAGTFSDNESEVLREMSLKSTKREIRNSWQAF